MSDFESFEHQSISLAYIQCKIISSELKKNTRQKLRHVCNPKIAALLSSLKLSAAVDLMMVFIIIKLGRLRKLYS